MYKEVGHLYDDIFYEDYDKWMKFITNNIDLNHKKILEFGCGSGNMTSRIAKEYRQSEIHAVDLSQSIISLAKGKQKVEKFRNVIYECDDVMNISGKYDMVLAFFDVVNFFVDNVNVLFSHIYNRLQDDGIFIFDVTSIYAMKYKLDETVMKLFEDDDTIIYNEFLYKNNENKLYMDFNIFTKKDNLYKKTEEKYILMGYDMNLINELKKAGFSDVKVYNDYSVHEEMHDDILRYTFVARR